MAMAGIMILLSDILDDTILWDRGPTYYQPALLLTAILLAIPIFLSPFISLYAQISRKSASDSIVTFREFVLNVFSVCLIIVFLLTPVAYFGYLEFTFLAI